MSTPSNKSLRIVLALSVTTVALMGFSLPAVARDGGAIAAGIAGGVAGTMSGQALSGAVHPPGYNGPPIRHSRTAYGEPQMVQKPYSLHIGQVRVCQ